MHKPSPSTIRRRGFSLLELTTVVLIIGILAAVATPNWAAVLAKYRADAAAQRIVTDLGRVQSLAYSTSTAQTLTLNVTQSTYQIAGLRGLDRASSIYTVDLTAEPYCSALVSANFAGATQISFDGYGQPAVAGGTIVVTCGSQQRTVTVDATTGKATYQ
ncbi:MAG TPA: type II secretion system protein [Pirellulaceae bacterium]|jgi:prepilin-type N-terminal cleavage/methylation domain-containing protein